MSTPSRTRRIATTAAYGGGALGVVGAVLYGVVTGEAKLAHRRIGPPDPPPPSGNGTWGLGKGTPLKLAVLGDSTAVGLGVTEAAKTPGALIASGLSTLADRPVNLLTVAANGATSANLADQIAQVESHEPEVVVIMIGANDVIKRVPQSQSVKHLHLAVQQFRDKNCQVIVGTCPDLGTVRPIEQPLRLICRIRSRQLAAAQTIAVVEAGGRTVSLGDILGPEFAARPEELFSRDRFHPSAEGYAAAVAVLLPSVFAALELPVTGDLPPRAFHPEGTRPIARAAASAASIPGTEVVPAAPEVQRRYWRKLAFLRRRRPQLVPNPTASAPVNAGSSPGQVTG